MERRALGRRVGGRCRAGRPRPGRGCVRFLRVRGSFVHAGRVGANALRFSGRLGGRTLAPGRYRLVATPAGGPAARVAFRIRR